MKNYYENCIKKYFLNLFLLFLFGQYSFSLSQTLTVSGKITASRFPVKNVSVTFIDNADTSLKYNTLTNELGQYQIGLVTSVSSNQNNVPSDFSLGQNYPNPFSSSTSIPYDLNEESNVEVVIYDILGRNVKNYDFGKKANGIYNLLWDGKNNFGRKVANGIYFYKFTVNGVSHVKKMILNQSMTNHLLLSNGISSFQKRSMIKKSISRNIQSNNFTIQLKNTTTTSPFFEEQELVNIEIQNDTTINFAVNTISVATINTDSLHQIIRGFGASNILMWRPDMTDGEIETAFGNNEGEIGFTILRIMVEPDSNRWGLNLTTVKKAQEMGAIIIASPWYAPSNMVETVNGVSRVKYDMYYEYAQHLNSFINFMLVNDVTLYGISVQNEPDITDQWTSWTSEEMFIFMRDYAQLIQGTNVMAPESFQFRRNMTDPILNDSAACANTDIVCGHIYGGGLAEYLLAEEKGKEVWMTEYLINSGNPPSDPGIDTGWTGAMQTAQSINRCMNTNMNAYVWWYLIRYYGPICDGTYLRKGEVTKKGYVMSQFSRFIRPGYYRVESSVSPFTSEVEISAYKDPESSKVVIVALNNSNSYIEQNFILKNSHNITFKTFTSSVSKNCELGNPVVSQNGNLKFSLERESITTFVSE